VLLTGETLADLEVITNAVRLACRAPSKHNSQPWRWVADSTTVDLFLDPDRVLYSADRTGHQALIGCGAVLDHFRVAMAATGWNTTVQRFPDPDSSDHLASIGLTTMAHVTETQRARAAAIEQRRTDRLPFYPPTDWESVEPVLRAAIGQGIVMLDVLADDARPRLAYATRLTESLRLYDERYHDEMRWWTTTSSQSEGVPYSSLVSESEEERVDLHRDFPAAGHGRRRAQMTHDEAKVLVLSTPRDTRSDALRCGEALSAVLLGCTMAGLATCILTHLTELAASRHIVQELTENDAVPQVLIRVGVAPPTDSVPPPTPRRALSDVLEIRGEG
jgi:nitroreductase